MTTELGRLRSLEGIESLPALTSLSIGLGWNRRASLDIEHLEGAQPLEHLAIGIVNPVVGLAPVSKLRKLTGVDMFYKDAKTAARIDEITFDRLPYLEEIRWWSSSRAEVPPKLNSLQAFASAPNLHKLDLVRTEVTGSLAPFTSCLTSRR